jgi:hypothetical protein
MGFSAQGAFFLAEFYTSCARILGEFEQAQTAMRAFAASLPIRRCVCPYGCSTLILGVDLAAHVQGHRINARQHLINYEQEERKKTELLLLQAAKCDGAFQMRVQEWTRKRDALAEKARIKKEKRASRKAKTTSETPSKRPRSPTIASGDDAATPSSPCRALILRAEDDDEEPDGYCAASVTARLLQFIDMNRRNGERWKTSAVISITGLEQWMPAAPIDLMLDLELREEIMPTLCGPATGDRFRWCQEKAPANHLILELPIPRRGNPTHPVIHIDVGGSEENVWIFSAIAAIDRYESGEHGHFALRTAKDGPRPDDAATVPVAYQPTGMGATTDEMASATVLQPCALRVKRPKGCGRPLCPSCGTGRCDPGQAECALCLASAMPPKRATRKKQAEEETLFSDDSESRTDDESPLFEDHSTFAEDEEEASEDRDDGTSSEETGHQTPGEDPTELLFATTSVATPIPGKVSFKPFSLRGAHDPPWSSWVQIAI